MTTHDGARVYPDTRFDFASEIIECIREIHRDVMERRAEREERELWMDLQERDIAAGGGWDE